MKLESEPLSLILDALNSLRVNIPFSPCSISPTLILEKKKKKNKSLRLYCCVIVLVNVARNIFFL